MTASTELLATLVHRKLLVLTQLHAIGARQAGLVDSGDTQGLLRLLSAKQQLVDALGQIERAMAPFHTQAPEQRVWSSPQRRAETAAQSQQCAALLAEIVAMEQKQEAHLQNRRIDLGQQLRQANSSAGAAGAYRAQHAAGPPRPAVREGASGAARLDLSS